MFSYPNETKKRTPFASCRGQPRPGSGIPPRVPAPVLHPHPPDTRSDRLGSRDADVPGALREVREARDPRERWERALPRWRVEGDRVQGDGGSGVGPTRGRGRFGGQSCFGGTYGGPRTLGPARLRGLIVSSIVYW